MKANDKLAVFAYLCLTCCPAVCESAQPQNGGDHSKAAGHDSVDLGGGLRLVERVQHSTEGEVSLRVSWVIHDGETLFRSIWSAPSKHGDPPTILQSYFSNGKVFISRQTGGKKGSLPILVLPDDAGVPAHIFDEEDDGSLVPWNKDRMEKARKDFSDVGAIMSPIVKAAREDAGKEELGKAVEEAVRRATQGTKEREVLSEESLKDEGNQQ